MCYIIISLENRVLLVSKIAILSESSRITSEQQLALAARDFFRGDPELEWRFVHQTPSRDPSYDALVRLRLDERDLLFAVEYRLVVGVQALALLAERKLPYPLLVVTPKLTENVVRLCRERRINCLDLNGRTWIRCDGVFIDRAASRDRPFRTAQAPPDVFSTKSARLVRTLLAEKTRVWTQADLVAGTRLSAGLVSRLLRQLRDDGFVERTDRSIRVVRHSELLDAWAAQDRWSDRVTLRQYSVVTVDLDELAERVLQFAATGSVAFTQWYAARERFPYTPPPVLTAYVAEFPDESRLREWQARPVTDGGRLWLAVPADPGVFQQLRVVRDRPLVADPQIYLDLLSVGLRGPDQAKALRDWEGFCR